MQSHDQRCDAVLVFAKRRLFDVEDTLRLVEMALEQKGLEIVASDEHTPGEIAISSEDMLITVKTDASDDDLMGRMMIAISDVSTSLHADTPLMLLADICRKALIATDASQIVWLRKDVVFSARQFLSAFAPVKPRRIDTERKTKTNRPAPRRVASGRAHQTAGRRLPHVDSMKDALDRKVQEKRGEVLDWTDHLTAKEEAALARAIRVDEAGVYEESSETELSRPTRITTWIMTAMLLFFSLPLTAFFVVYNLFKGEDFRLSAHALSLAGAFTLLNSSGATAATLQLFIG